MLKRSGGGGADGDDAISRLLSGVYRFGGRCREGVMLGVEVNIFHIFCADGLESSKANVESDGLDLYSLLFQLVENFCREVQAGSGGGGRARFMREDCLVAVAVLWAVLSMDVRREGHVTYFVDDSGKIWSGGKS